MANDRDPNQKRPSLAKDCDGAATGDRSLGSLREIETTNTYEPQTGTEIANPGIDCQEFNSLITQAEEFQPDYNSKTEADQETIECDADSSIEHKNATHGLEVLKRLEIYLKESLQPLEDYFSFPNIISRYRQHLHDLAGAKIKRLIKTDAPFKVEWSPEICQYYDYGQPQEQPKPSDFIGTSNDPVQLASDISAVLNQLKSQSDLVDFTATSKSSVGNRIFIPPTETVDQATKQALEEIYRNYLTNINQVNQSLGERPCLVDISTEIYLSCLKPVNIDEGLLQTAIEGRIIEMINAEIGPEPAAELKSKGDGLSHYATTALIGIIWGNDWRRYPRFYTDMGRGVSINHITWMEAKSETMAEEIISQWSQSDRQKLDQILTEREVIYQQELAKLIFLNYRMPFDAIISKLRAIRPMMDMVRAQQARVGNKIIDLVDER